jgi:uncharacterized membrane protein YkgB
MQATGVAAPRRQSSEEHQMNRRYGALRRLGASVARWLTRHSVALLRASVGLIFLGFGALKFVPGLSPAEGLVHQTVSALTFGLIPEGAGLLLVAALETVIGLSLLTGWFVRLGLALLGLTMAGILSPLVLFTDRLFAGPFNAPTLEGQYVLQGVVLLAAALVIAARPQGRRPAAARRGRPTRRYGGASPAGAWARGRGNAVA